jgi:hypothetical protein
MSQIKADWDPRHVGGVLLNNRSQNLLECSRSCLRDSEHMAISIMLAESPMGK